MNEEELIIFEKGFEEGYAVAKRLYKIRSISYTNESFEIIYPELNSNI